MTPSEREAARELGAQVRAVRQRAGMTLERLAAHAALSRTTVQRIEAGRVIADANELMALAVALGVDMAELVAELGRVGADREGRRDVGELVRVYLELPEEAREPLRRFLRAMAGVKRNERRK